MKKKTTLIVYLNGKATHSQVYVDVNSVQDWVTAIKNHPDMVITTGYTLSVMQRKGNERRRMPIKDFQLSQVERWSLS